MTNLQLYILQGKQLLVVVTNPTVVPRVDEFVTVIHKQTGRQSSHRVNAVSYHYGTNSCEVTVLVE